jgi:phosphoribosylformylglycinamidine cyclo-ligase
MVDYATSGVSLDRASEAKKLIAKAAQTTFTPQVLRDVGHFGGFFALGDSPTADVLVASTDGVGTKILLGLQLDMLDGLGRDLVHHSINDILVCGARPLFFLDYMAFGRLDVEIAGRIAESLAAGCREHGVALIGGETAEMPGLYRESDFDLAGTIVGIVQKDKILDGSKVVEGDVLIGLPSSGLHTNGYSLARKVLEDKIAAGTLKTTRLSDGQSLAQALMEPHRCYLKVFGDLLTHSGLHALSHITGGGIEDNTMRVVPKGLHLQIDWGSWTRPELFEVIQKHGEVAEAEMRRAMNLGVGLIAIVAAERSNEFIALLGKREPAAFIMGHVSA